MAVVVPARDEARFIVETLRTIPAWVDDIVVVDDGSRDATSRLAVTVSSPSGERRPVEVVRHEVPLGVGAAIAAGYRRALALGADVVAVMAGDGQMHPDDLEAVLAPVLDGRADYAKGNRFDHPEWERMPRQRFVAGRVLSRLTGFAVGLPGLRDSQSGYTAISRGALLAIDLDRLWPSYGYPNDLLGLLCREGQRCADVVIRPVYRGEASGLRPWHLATIGFLIGRAYARRVVSERAVIRDRGAPRTEPSPSHERPLPRGAGTRPTPGLARPISPKRPEGPPPSP